MTGRVPLVMFFVLLIAVSVVGSEFPQVLQPNETAYSSAEVATLTRAITILEGTLTNYNLGSRRYFTSTDWGSRNFAEYTGGLLAEQGYQVKLVSQAGWPDGVHTWVLVGISLGTQTAWVPVEASPQVGRSQPILGYIPTITDGTGRLWFETSYLNFTDVIELPPNLPPVARIRPPLPPVKVDVRLTFMAVDSYDSDGEIVLYKWDFGDGMTHTATTWVARHSFDKEGTYVLTLTVIDNRGKSATTSITLHVLGAGERTTTPPGGGCGCGG